MSRPAANSSRSAPAQKAHPEPVTAATLIRIGLADFPRLPTAVARPAFAAFTASGRRLKVISPTARRRSRVTAGGIPSSADSVCAPAEFQRSRRKSTVNITKAMVRSAAKPDWTRDAAIGRQRWTNRHTSGQLSRDFSAD